MSRDNIMTIDEYTSIHAQRNGATGKAATGGLVRDCSSQWTTGFHREMHTNSSAMAEIWALRDGLKLALSENIKKLHVETDALSITQLHVQQNTTRHPLLTSLQVPRGAI